MGVGDLSWVVIVATWLFIIIRAQAAMGPTTNQSQLACEANDLRALQGFMAALQKKELNGWQETNASSNCCQWEGVTCNSSSSLGLQSSSSSEIEIGRVVKLELPSKSLFGNISESVGSLDQLRALNLSHNLLKSSLPSSLFRLPNLQVLDLSFNDLYGQLPDFINLTSINYLDLSQNYFNGSLPTRICGASSALRVVQLAANYFSGDVPPGFGDCGSLERLSLGMNYLTGMSEDFFRLKKLSDLILSDNRLSGPLSQGIGNLTSLFHLDISSNEFSGNIPNVFHKFKKLQSFVAHSNNFTGNLPVSLSNSPTISTLNLRNNSLEGKIELNCSAMVNLTSLDLATNRFSGKDFHSLSYFSLSNSTNNNLSSALGILQHCRNLTTLVLSINFLNDELPQDSDLHFERLKILIIANCGLRGSVPQWLRKSEKLQLLDLSWNSLVGTIPAWLGDYKFLFYLNISNNSLTGEIPRNLTGLRSLIDFPFFMKRDVSVRGLQYNQVRSFLPTLDLSFNQLSGPIWPEFGNLRKLLVLDLKVNNLSGEIPDSLSGMSSLEFLDLSNNSLTGTIPSSFGKTQPSVNV